MGFFLYGPTEFRRAGKLMDSRNHHFIIGIPDSIMGSFESAVSLPGLTVTLPRFSERNSKLGQDKISDKTKKHQNQSDGVTQETCPAPFIPARWCDLLHSNKFQPFSKVHKIQRQPDQNHCWHLVRSITSTFHYRFSKLLGDKWPVMLSKSTIEVKADGKSSVLQLHLKSAAVSSLKFRMVSGLWCTYLEIRHISGHVYIWFSLKVDSS